MRKTWIALTMLAIMSAAAAAADEHLVVCGETFITFTAYYEDSGNVGRAQFTIRKEHILYGTAQERGLYFFRTEPPSPGPRSKDFFAVPGDNHYYAIVSCLN